MVPRILRPYIKGRFFYGSDKMNYIDEFNKYAKTFDLTVKQIMSKYHHSFRVMEFAKEIAISLNLDKEDIELASICGLFHDIGRFRQWTDYKTYEDQVSIDHGDLGYEILEYFLNDYKYKDIVLKATKYHNKYTVPDFDEKTMLFCNIVRDADKLDIIREQCNQVYQKEVALKDKLLSDIYRGIICHNEDIENEVDSIVRMLSWIFDYNFKYSYHFLLDKKIIENKFNLLKIYGETEEIKELEKFIYSEIEKRL